MTKNKSKMSKHIGKQTVAFANPPVILAGHSIVGPMEGKGPLGKCFNKILPDTLDGQSSWEKTESKMLKDAVTEAIKKAGLTENDVDMLLAGDLLNQLSASNFAARSFAIPFIGIYGACSTMALGLAISSMIIDGGFANKVVTAASSHHNAAERQYRYPTELGTQRAMSAQWTVTGAGASVLSSAGNGVKVTRATFGKVIDLGVSDVGDMGAAMAPAVVDTMLTHFQDLAVGPDDYDLILSGDLGQVGMNIAKDLADREGFTLNNYTDCGVMIYDISQDAHAGGSGCGCSAVVVNGHFMRELLEKRLKKILFIGSGALLSPTTSLQGETIPAIGHAVVLEGPC